MVIRTLIFALVVALISSCESISHYTIDEKPQIKTDSALLGIWKAAEDTDKANYILVQTYDDVMKKYPGKPDQVHYKDYHYYLTYMDHQGKNPHYQQFTSFMSKVEDIPYLNIMWWHNSPYDSASRSYHRTEGFFFVRIIKWDKQHGTMITAIIADKRLPQLKNSTELRALISQNQNNAPFYSDTMHFTKISSFHESLRESKDVANPK